MITILPLVILLLGNVLHLSHSLSCSNNKILRSEESKTINTTETTEHHEKVMVIEVDKLYPCEDFQAVILEVEDVYGKVRKVSFPTNGTCWKVKSEWKKLKGKVILSGNYLNYSLNVSGCLMNVPIEKKEFTHFRRFNIVGHGQSYWCLGVRDPPKKLEPPPASFTCQPFSVTYLKSSGSTKVLVIVGWVALVTLVVATLAVTSLVVWCVCRRRSSQSTVVAWRRAMAEQSAHNRHVSENNLYESFSNPEEGAAFAPPQTALHSRNSLYEPFSSPSASSGHSDSGGI